MTGETRRIALSYVLPLRWRDDAQADELTAYLEWLAGVVEQVLVVDGSSPGLYTAHAERWGEAATHLPPDPDLHYLMGKVNGVETGLRRVCHDAVVIADDDVRYDEATLRAMAHALADADLVRPHNFFAPLPWRARWETGRVLLNRALGGDYPGTLGVRAECFRAIGGYDGDVMFENLELMRSVRAAGGRVVTRWDLLVARRPPSARHFLSQRVRQAYDDFALPARMALFLLVLPVGAAALANGRARALLGAGAGCVGLAEAGRRRGGGARVYPLSGSLLAPGWVLERSVTSWLAMRQRVVHGGTIYGEVVIPRPATSMRELRRRLAGRAPRAAAPRRPSGR